MYTGRKEFSGRARCVFWVCVGSEALRPGAFNINHSQFIGPKKEDALNGTYKNPPIKRCNEEGARISGSW
jgi:hypothetical protein